MSGWGLVPGASRRRGAGTISGVPVPTTRATPPAKPVVTWLGFSYTCPLCGVEVRRGRLNGRRPVLLTADGERHPVICDGAA